MDSTDTLVNKLLIALPVLSDTNFNRGVALIYQHDSNGAMGMMINRVSEYTLGAIFQKMDIKSDNQELCARRVLMGGPVHNDRGFVLHDGQKAWNSSLEIADGLYVTTSRDILEAMACGEGPNSVVVALGCAGWAAGQLEAELIESNWLVVPSDLELLFSSPLEARWQAAAGRIGVDMMQVMDYSGHA